MRKGNAPCLHTDGEFCEKCWPPKSKNTKTAISIFLHLSKVGDKHYVAIDGNPIDLKDFGITPENFSRLGDEIENVLQKIMVTNYQPTKFISEEKND